jgi:hypothetical protein
MSTVEKRRRRMVGPTRGPSGCGVEAVLGWMDTADVTLSQLPFERVFFIVTGTVTDSVTSWLLFDDQTRR